MTHGCVMVTGASRGIGAAIAEQLARTGFVVGCLSRTGCTPQREDVPDAVRARWIPLEGDITDDHALAQAFATLKERTNAPLAGLVNNAGIHLEGPSERFALTDFSRVMTTNATSLLAASQAAFPYLCETKASVIVNIGSFFDRLGVKRNVAYCASKAAVGAITRCLAAEWAKHGIRVINVAPGYIVTDLNREEMAGEALRAFLEKRIPLRKPGEVDDVAHLVASMFGPAGAFMTGETLYVDGGQGIAL
jgi:NAD(P)-dependent dehydrogenase (short-subunit alcohol dehydrogenase family)